MTPDEVKAVAGTAFIVITLVSSILIFVGMAIGNGYVAARLGKSVPLWVILSLIPGVNLFFIYYVWFYVVCRMLNRLNQIAARLDALR